MVGIFYFSTFLPKSVTRKDQMMSSSERQLTGKTTEISTRSLEASDGDSAKEKID